MTQTVKTHKINRDRVFWGIFFSVHSKDFLDFSNFFDGKRKHGKAWRKCGVRVQ